MSNPNDPNLPQQPAPQYTQPPAPQQPAPQQPQYAPPAQPAAAPSQYPAKQYPVQYPAQPYQQQYPAPQYATAPPNNVLAIISMISSIVGFFTFGILSILGVILGHIGLSQIKNRGEGGRGFAITGLIVGYIGIGLYLLWLLVVIVFIGIFGVAASTY